MAVSDLFLDSGFGIHSRCMHACFLVGYKLCLV